jgi:hypothetical protein
MPIPRCDSHHTSAAARTSARSYRDLRSSPVNSEPRGRGEIWLVSFLDFYLGYFDEEGMTGRTCRITSRQKCCRQRNDDALSKFWQMSLGPSQKC